MGADARMPGRASPSWCWVRGGPPGLDCPGRGKAPRTIRRREARQLAREAAVEVALRRTLAA